MEQKNDSDVIETSLFDVPKDVVWFMLDKFLDDVETAVFRCVCRWTRGLVRNETIQRCRGKLFLHSAANGDVARLQWLVHDQRIPVPTFCVDDICATAALNKQLGVLLWARDHSLHFTAWTFARAAEGGSLDVVRWLRREAKCDWDKWTPALAAKAGNHEVLEWCWRNSCEIDEETCSGAAATGRLEILEWLKHVGCCFWTCKTCAVAAETGHLPVLVWLKANGCQWDSFTCEAALLCGHLDIFSWALANGCPCDARIRAIAVERRIL
jgi:hypothetical protein